MYGLYLAAVMEAEKKLNPQEINFHWFSCLNCEVMWKENSPRDHCFVCGRWGSRGKLI